MPPLGGIGILTPPGGVMTDVLQPAAMNVANAMTSRGLVQLAVTGAWLCFMVVALISRGMAVIDA